MPVGALVLVGLPVLAACSSSNSSSTPTTAPGGSPTATASGGSPSATASGSIPTDIGKNDHANITGTGSTLAAPVYLAWAQYYKQDVASGVSINYQSLGSGAGIQQYTAGTVAFGASDAPMTDSQLAAAPDTQHIPTLIGAVVMIYNLSGVTQTLKFDGTTIAKIYLGTITKWNDPAIKALNPGVSLPDATIQVVHRSDGSGTSNAFTDYLSKVNSEWQSKVGFSTNPAWPVGQGGKGSEGVTSLVKNTPNSIGYVELNYALTNHLAFADVENAAGNFISPTLQNSALAADGVTVPADFRVSITNPPASNAQAYPISTFTYILVHKSYADCSQIRPVLHWLWWAFNSSKGQQAITQLSFAPLPAAMKDKDEAAMKAITCAGQPALAGTGS